MEEQQCLVKIINFQIKLYSLMKDLSLDFPALTNQTYLNNASTGLLSTSLAEWRQQHETDFLQQGANYAERKHIIEETRANLARIMGAHVQETALIPNFSYGINLVWEGVPKGQKVLVLKEDYPSVRWPVETGDFDICYAEIDGQLEDNIQQAVEQHRPDIFIFSIVQWLSGVKIDLEFIKQLKAYHPQMLIIADGTQFVGTQPFDFRTNGIDILAASGYKWMMAGFGNGFLLVKEEVQEKIFPSVIGFNSAKGFDSEATETEFIRRFEPGHQDTFNFGSLNQAVLKMEDVGLDFISEVIGALASRAKEQFIERGLLDTMTTQRVLHSSIFNLKGNQELFRKLKEEAIICSLRGGGIRVSFHYYNTTDDLEKLLAVIP